MTAVHTLVAIVFWPVFGLCLIFRRELMDYLSDALRGRQHESWAQKRARLLYDCDRQHDAWRWGQDAIATYGRYQPQPIRVDGEWITVWAGSMPKPVGNLIP